MARVDEDEAFQVLKRRARHRLIGAALIALFLVSAVPALLNHPRAMEPKEAESEPQAPLPDPSMKLSTETPEVKAAEASVPPISNSEPAPALPLPAAPSTVIPPIAMNPPAPSSPPQPSQKSLPPPTALPAPPDVSQPVADPPPQKLAKSERGWFVQIGVFAEEGRAQDLKERFKDQGIELKSDVLKGPRGSFTRLRAGPFEDRVEASRLLARARSLEDNAILVHQ